MMKNFFNKYFFFLKKENHKNPECLGITGNLILLIGFIFFYWGLFFYATTEHDIHSANSALVSIPLIRFAAFWIDIRNFKVLIPEIWQKFKDKNLQYASSELYLSSSVFIYTMTLFTWLFIVDWEVMGKVGIVKSGFFGFVIVGLGYVQYRRNLKNERRRRKRK